MIETHVDEKPSWVIKDDCLGRRGCGNPSTLVINAHDPEHPGYSATIRCCSQPGCKSAARRLARRSLLALVAPHEES